MESSLLYSEQFFPLCLFFTHPGSFLFYTSGCTQPYSNVRPRTKLKMLGKVWSAGSHYFSLPRQSSQLLWKLFLQHITLWTPFEFIINQTGCFSSEFIQSQRSLIRVIQFIFKKHDGFLCNPLKNHLVLFGQDPTSCSPGLASLVNLANLSVFKFVVSSDQEQSSNTRHIRPPFSVEPQLLIYTFLL